MILMLTSPLMGSPSMSGPPRHLMAGRSRTGVTSPGAAADHRGRRLAFDRGPEGAFMEPGEGRRGLRRGRVRDEFLDPRCAAADPRPERRRPAVRVPGGGELGP